MQIFVEARRGLVIVLSTVAQPFYRKPTNEAAMVEVYRSYADEPPGNGVKIGEVMPGNTLTVEYSPENDRDVRISVRARDARGTYDREQLRDCDSVIVPIERTAAPSLIQLEDATHTAATLGVVTNRFAKRMKVETSEVSDFSSGVITTEEDITPGNIAIPITRTGAGSGTLVLYTRVSISNGGEYGPPTTLSFTFANLAGSGGSTGSGGYPPGAIVPVEHAE